MGWQATGDSWSGGTPDQEPGLPAPRPPIGFGHGGAWESVAPSAALALALEQAAGPEDAYAGADTDALVGIARQWAAVESWAAAGKLATLRAMTREDGDGTPRLRRRPDLPDGWDDSLSYEISAALAMGPVSADNLACLAWALGTRLAGTGRLLADGTLTMPKAKLIAQLFQPLDDDEAARAEALVLGELAGKTYPQVQRLAWQAALAVAPDAAGRLRAAAEQHARVTVFREESGTVGLAGRDLPAADALAGHASVVARAAEYEASGAFPGQSTGRLQALAYTDLLNQVSARDRIMFTRTASAQPPAGPRPDDGHEDDDGTGHGDGGGDSEPSGGGGRPDAGSSDGCPGPAGEDGSDGEGPGTHDSPDDPAGRGDGDGADPGGSGHGPGERGNNGGDSSLGEPDNPRMPSSALAEITVPLAEITVPLATLQGRAELAGDSRLLGPIDPALARDLTAVAARSPGSRWALTIIDEHGYAVGHGVARPWPSRPPPGPVSSALPARVNITITETFLRQLRAQMAHPPPGDWALISANPGTWMLTLPGGRQLAVRFDIVPTHDCDHKYRVNSYLPGDRLRRLVQVRDHSCTWPPCSRPARECDFEHAVPYDKGGATCACNAGARSRRCHQVKQLPGWTVTQPRPGWHVWITPTGRTYVKEPWRYTA